MTFCPKYEYDPNTKPTPDFTKFQLPLIRKVYPRLIASQLVGVQPMQIGGLLEHKSVFVKQVADDTWESCSYDEICKPDYEPFFGLWSNDGFAIYNKDFVPIVCTDRKIFKTSEIEKCFEEGAVGVTKEPWVFRGENPPHRKRDNIFLISWSNSNNEKSRKSR